jgi:anti-sigma regulatory factor (Ser/Thr protein kinase)
MTKGQSENMAVVVLPAEGASVAEGRHRVAEWMSGLGCSDGCVTDAVIAVGEAVTNAVRHAYDRRKAGEVRLSVAQSGTNALISIEDDGRGPGPNLNRRGDGSCLGIELMAELADRLTIEGRKDLGTTVTLTFPCPQT